MKVAILCVNYNSFKEFQIYYRSIKKAEKTSNVNVTVILFDNSSSIKKKQLSFIQKLQAEDNNFKFIASKNLGYLGTVQTNLKKIKINFDSFDLLCITNVDLKIKQDFFSSLEKTIFPDSLGMIGPSIISRKEINKNPKIHKRPSLLKLYINILMHTFPFTSKLQFMLHHLRLKKDEKHFNTLPKNNSFDLKPIYALHGSFTMFSPKAFKLIMDNKYPIFLFGEEIFFAEITRLAGLNSYFSPSLVVFDDEHVSTGKLPSWTYRKLNIKALLYIIRKFYF